MRPNRGTFAIRSRGILSGFFASAALMGAFGCALAVIGSGGGEPSRWPARVSTAIPGHQLRLIAPAPTPTQQPLAALGAVAPVAAVAAPVATARTHAVPAPAAPRIASERQTAALAPPPAPPAPAPAAAPAAASPPA